MGPPLRKSEQKRAGAIFWAGGGRLPKKHRLGGVFEKHVLLSEHVPDDNRLSRQGGQVASKARLVPGSGPLMDNALGSHLIEDAVSLLQLESSGRGLSGLQYSLFCRTDHRAIPAISDASLGRRAHPLFTLFVLWHSAKKSLIFLKLLPELARNPEKFRVSALQSRNISKPQFKVK
jgi:hypothetical protein